MIITISGHLFARGSARSSPATLSCNDAGICTIESQDQLPKLCDWRRLDISDRLGSTRRRLTFEDGRVFETTDNDAVDNLQKQFRGNSGSRLIDLLERKKHFIIMACLVTALAGYGFVKYVVPATARVIAFQLPAGTLDSVSSKTLEALERKAITKSRLPALRQTRITAMFNELRQNLKTDRDCCRLRFYKGNQLGANALALPDGTIVITDELITMAGESPAGDTAILGVLAHEIGHVQRRHALQAVIQSSMTSVALVLIAGDLNHMSEFLLATPAALLQASYSRNAEHESDAFALATLQDMKRSTAPLANLLDKMSKTCGKKCKNGWLSSHPATAERIRMLRQAK